MAKEFRNVISLIIQGKDLSKDELDQVNARVDKLGQSLQKAGAIAVAAGAAIAAGLAVATKSAADLEEQVVNALTLVQEQGDAFAAMKGRMTTLSRDLSRSLNVDAKEIAAGYYQVLSTGTKATSEGFEALTTTALKLSKVTGLELAFSVERLAGITSAFNLDLATQVDRIADVAFTATRLAQTDLPQLAQAYREAAPTAEALGQSVETTTTILAIFADKMIKANVAGTSFRIIANRLAKSLGPVADEMKRIGVDAFDPTTGSMRDMIDVIEDLQIATSEMTDKQRIATSQIIAGEEAFTKLSILLAVPIDKFREYKSELLDGGALQDAFNKKLEAFNEKTKAVSIELKNLSRAIGGPLIDNVGDFLEQVTRILRAMTDWSIANPQVSEGLLTMAAVLIGAGGLSIAIGTTIRLAGTLKIALAAFTVGSPLIVGIIAGIAAIAGLATAIKSAREEAEKAEERARIKRSLTFERTDVIPTGTPIEDLLLGEEGRAKKAAEERAAAIAKAAAVAAAKAWFDALIKAGVIAGEFPPKVLPPGPSTGSERLQERDLITTDVMEHLEEDLQEMEFVAEQAGFAIASGITSGFETIETGANVMETIVKNTFRNIASFVIGEIERMIAKWLALKFVMTALNFILPGLGSAVGAVGSPTGGGIQTRAGLQHGGTFLGSTRGIDNLIAKVGSGESIIDSSTTDNLKEFLSETKRGGGGGTVLEQHFHLVAATFSEQEAVDFGRISQRETTTYDRRFVSKGRTT